jgi:hypothetical protein
VRHDALRSSFDLLQFGLKDLALSGDFSEGSSELECSYGIGLRPGSADARAFLAGAGSFRPEAVEIWAVSSSATAGLQLPPPPPAQQLHETADIGAGGAVGAEGSGQHEGGAGRGAPLQTYDEEQR